MAKPLSSLFRKIGEFREEDPIRSFSDLQEEIARTLDRIRDVFAPIESEEIEVALTAGSATTVRHRLGAIPNRFSVVYLDADLRVYKTGEWTDTTLQLTAAGTGSSTAKVLIWRVD